MFSIPEQFSNATKANFEAQFAIFSTLTNKAFEGVEKFVDLNLTAAKASLEESSATTKQLLAAKDPQEFFSLAAAQAQPSAEKTIAYGRHLATIASSTGAEFSKAAETQIAETNRKVISLVEEVSKNQPVRKTLLPCLNRQSAMQTPATSNSPKPLSKQLNRWKTI
jgi:phasin family protein